MADPKRPYNPLDRMELGKSVERALLAQPLTPLSAFTVRGRRKFEGAGLYALYYTGNVPYYKPIAPPQRSAGEVPIYVGQARPKGARQGALGLSPTTEHPALFERLREHANSIRAVERYPDGTDELSLRLVDFQCRYLVADDIWVPLGEALLIGHYRPLWNIYVDGFGNHAAGVGRKDQARSTWDTLHPGRDWAFKHKATRTRHEIELGINERLGRMVEADLDSQPDIDEEVQRALASNADI